ncbi:hypothetical protein RIF29_00165 [Crotalaria pallida]|uniref:Uncharacterized protein n=1 Tax=Crotalaria pallida TaxID=3830 RepID=A0AAN9IWC7_CROPI
MSDNVEPMVFSTFKEPSVVPPKPPDKEGGDALGKPSSSESVTVDPGSKEKDANGSSLNHKIPIFEASVKSTHGEWMIVDRRRNFRKGVTVGANNQVSQVGKKGVISNPFSLLSLEDNGNLNNSRATFSTGVSPTKEPVSRRKWVRKRARNSEVKIHEQDQNASKVQDSTIQPVSQKANVASSDGPVSTINPSQPSLHGMDKSDKNVMHVQKKQPPKPTKPSFKFAMNIEWVSGNKFCFLDDEGEVDSSLHPLNSSNPPSNGQYQGSGHASSSVEPIFKGMDIIKEPP